MSTGLGGGKTAFLARMVTMLAYAAPPGVVGLFGAPTYPMLRDVDMRACEEFWDAEGIPVMAHRSEHAYSFLEAGNEILFRSLEFPDRLRGINAAYGLGDETRDWTEYGFNIFASRIRDPRFPWNPFVGASTPNGFDWQYDKFAEVGGAKRLPDTEMVTGTSLENRYLPSGYAEMLAAALDPELYKQEVLGQIVAVGQGTAYHAFDRTRNRKAFDVDVHLPILLGCDFNIIDGGWVVSQGDPSRGIPLRAIDEIACVGSDSTNKACKEFLARYGKHPAGFEVFADATGQSRKTTGYSDFEAIRQQLGVNARSLSGNPRQKDRVAAVNALFHNAKDEVRLYVHPSKCPKLTRDLERVKWEAGGYQLDKADHSLTNYSDALGYLVAFRFPVLADRSQPRRAA